jgi:hypothetical protein
MVGEEADDHRDQVVRVSAALPANKPTKPISLLLIALSFASSVAGPGWQWRTAPVK